MVLPSRISTYQPTVIRMFLGLPDPHPDPLVTSNVPIRLRILPSSSKNSKKNLEFYCFLTCQWLLIFEEYLKCTSVPNPHSDLYVFGPPGSASESVSRRYESEDPADPYQNVTDPQHCYRYFLQYPVPLQKDQVTTLDSWKERLPVWSPVQVDHVDLIETQLGLERQRRQELREHRLRARDTALQRGTIG